MGMAGTRSLTNMSDDTLDQHAESQAFEGTPNYTGIINVSCELFDIQLYGHHQFHQVFWVISQICSIAARLKGRLSVPLSLSFPATCTQDLRLANVPLADGYSTVQYLTDWSH